MAQSVRTVNRLALDPLLGTVFLLLRIAISVRLHLNLHCRRSETMLIVALKRKVKRREARESKTMRYSGYTYKSPPFRKEPFAKATANETKQNHRKNHPDRKSHPASQP